MDGQNDVCVTESNCSEVDVPSDVNQRKSEGPNLTPDGHALENAGSESARGVHVGSRVVLGPCILHGAIGGLDAEVSQTAGLSHDPHDAVGVVLGHRLEFTNSALRLGFGSGVAQ